MFSEKCDGYREGRVKLQNKIKKRDEKIAQLIERIAQYEKMIIE